MDIVYASVYLDDIEEKLSRLSSVLKELGDQKGKIDMSNDDYNSKIVFTK